MSISNVISLFSGIALFLFGMTLMGDGLKSVSGSKIEPILYRLSNTPLKAILLGTGVTAVIQSSSATSIMVVGFVNSKMMKIRQGIPIILGAILGTSITGWVVCLSYISGTSGISGLLSTSTLTGIVSLVGIGLRMFSKNPTHKHVGDIMMGFAILMTGMSTMSGSVRTLGDQPWFTDLLTSMTNPILGILAGLLFSAVLQSASAAVGIVQALSLTGAMTLSNALPLLMGICIGASLPVLLSALGAEPAGKRTAFSYLIASAFGVIIVAVIFYLVNAFVHFPFLNLTMDPFSLAFVNTILRLAILALLAPLTGVLEAAATLIVPKDPKEDEVDETTIMRLEERFLAHPALAVEQSRETIYDMAVLTEESIRSAFSLFEKYSNDAVEDVVKLEAGCDHYEDVLGSYLVKLTGTELTPQQNRTVSLYLHTLTDFERISDHALNIAQSMKDMAGKGSDFSDDAHKELRVISSAVMECLHLAVEAFLNDDLDTASHVEPLEEVVDVLSDELKHNHVVRLQNGDCTIIQGITFNDITSDLERISDHCSNIAVALIELYSGSFDTHEYLDNVKTKRSKNYEEHYRNYLKKYEIKAL